MPTAPAPTPSKQIRCYHCGHRFGVAARAMRITCPKCTKGVLIDDIVVKGAQGVSKMQPGGRIPVKRGARLIAELVHADLGLEVQGTVQASVVTRGPVTLGGHARWTGDLTAPSIDIRQGARIENGYFDIGPHTTRDPPDD